MTTFRVLLSIAALTGACLALSTSAAAQNQPESQYLLKTDTAQAAPAKPGMGMHAGATTPGYADQMNAMNEMHEKMLAATKPDERNALMAEQMELMHNGMHMMDGMGGMGAGAGTGSTDDMPARQGMMEERMGMMHSMMQMMMDRMQSVPATK